MKTRRLFLAGLLALLFTPPLHGGDEIAVISHKSLSASSIGSSDLRPIFQTTKTSWSGLQVMPVNLPPEDPTRKGFDAAVLGLDPDRVARYWIDRKIRGGNAPPKTIPNVSMVLKVVASKAEAVGYVPVASVTGDVKVIAKIRGGQVVAP